MNVKSTAARALGALALASATLVTLTGTANAAGPMPSIRSGQHGIAVQCVQSAIKLAGLGTTSERLKVDGDFGPATKGAVEDFQRAAGLQVDGIVGQRTGRHLWDVIDETEQGRAALGYCWNYLPTNY